jgi:hypothetical protein
LAVVYVYSYMYICRTQRRIDVASVDVAMDDASAAPSPIVSGILAALPDAGLCLARPCVPKLIDECVRIITAGGTRVSSSEGQKEWSPAHFEALREALKLIAERRVAFVSAWLVSNTKALAADGDATGEVLLPEGEPGFGGDDDQDPFSDLGDAPAVDDSLTDALADAGGLGSFQESAEGSVDVLPDALDGDNDAPAETFDEAMSGSVDADAGDDDAPAETFEEATGERP